MIAYPTYILCTGKVAPIEPEPPLFDIEYSPFCTAYVNISFYDTIHIHSTTPKRYKIVKYDSTDAYRLEEGVIMWRPAMNDTGSYAFQIAVQEENGHIVKVLPYTIIVLTGLPKGCPAYMHRDDVSIGTAKNLPEGFFVFDRDTIPGLYKSPLRVFRSSLIPSTNNDYPRSISLSNSGEWIFYVDSRTNIFYVIQANGCHKSIMPTTGIPSGKFFPGGFYRNSPYGEEMFYLAGTQQIRACKVTFSENGPIFSRDRIIASLASLYLNPLYTNQYAVSHDQIFGEISPVATNGNIVARTGYLTIPKNGTGIAGDGDLYQWADDRYEPIEGCGHTMSFDGQFVLANAGPYYYPSKCVPTGHKGFYVAPFRRSDDSPLDQYAENLFKFGTSLNWCPERYRSGDYDFWGWYFTNNNNYVAGRMLSLDGNSCAWMIEWRNSIWIPLCPPDSNIRIQQPAAHIGELDTGRSYLDSACHYNDTVVNPGNDSGNPLYQVRYPNGGERYHINEPCTVKVSSKKPGNAMLFLLIDRKRYSILLSTSRSFDPQIDSLFIFEVPDTINVYNEKIYPVSDECLIRIADYSNPMHYYDESDAYFQIVP